MIFVIVNLSFATFFSFSLCNVQYVSIRFSCTFFRFCPHLFNLQISFRDWVANRFEPITWTCSDISALRARVSLRCAGGGCCTVRWRCSLPANRLRPRAPLRKNHNAIARAAGVERSTTTHNTQPVYIQMRWNSHAVHHDGSVVSRSRFLLKWPFH